MQDIYAIGGDHTDGQYNRNSATQTGHAIATISSNGRVYDFLPPERDVSEHIREVTVNERDFKLRLADTEAGRNSASMLINKMYSWRGYSGSHELQPSPNRITLTASDKDMVVGTVTLNIDSSVGILADEIFKEEIDQHRKQGGKLCEFAKLAINPDIHSKWVLASLFHIAFIYGRRIHQCTEAFIEVNPRHRRFYQRMLGFRMHGAVKMNRRVNAPACLLSLPLSYAEEQIVLLGGRANAAELERSLYPYFFSAREEQGITGRLFTLG